MLLKAKVEVYPFAYQILIPSFPTSIKEIFTLGLALGVGP